MPTAARLVAAILLAALGWFIADLIKPYIPSERPVGLFSPISAAMGVAVGWVFTGRKLDRGAGSAVQIGIASVALQAIWVAFLFSGYDMLKKSLRRAYDGPMEAIVDVVQIGIGHFVTAGKLDVIVAALIGGLIVGGATHWVAARFR